MSIANKLNKLEETKAAIKTAITNKGVEVSESDTFASYANKINSIPTGGGSNLGFEDLGYSYTPTYIDEGLTVGKQMYDNFNPNAYYWSTAFGNIDFSKVRYFPKVTLSEGDRLYSGSFIDNMNFYNLEIIPDFKFGECTVARFQLMTNLRSVHLGGTLILTQTNTFDGDVNLKDISGNIDISRTGVLNNLFKNCQSLNDISKLNLIGIPSGSAANCFSSVGNYNGSSRSVSNLETIPEINLSEVTSINNYCLDSGIKVIPYLNSTSAVDVSIHCEKNIKVTRLDMDSAIGAYGVNIVSSGSSCRYILLYNMGKAEGLTNVYLNTINLGVEDESIPESAGALQALKDSLITNSFDRAAAGYSNCTISLHSNTKALLTEDEIAQITAKGYTIS